MFDLWRGCEMVTYKLTVVERKDVSFKVWAVGETDPDFLPTRVKEEWAPQTHTIHIYARPHISGLQRVYVATLLPLCRLEFSQSPPPQPHLAN